MDREKERDRLVAQLVDSSIKATGQALEGAFAGAGFAMQGYLSGDALGFAAKSVAGLAALAWFVGSYPKLAHELHIDRFPGLNFQPLPPTDQALGPYGISFSYFDSSKNTILAWDTVEQRDAAFDIIKQGDYELLHGISAIYTAQRLVDSGRDGPYTEERALVRVSQLAAQGIATSYVQRPEGIYVVYPSKVGAWVINTY